MIRQSLIKTSKPALRLQQRTISTSIARMAGGDTGAPRSQGMASGDAFTKREEANENYYVKQREKEKSAALPDVLAICSLCHKVARTAKEDQGTARTS
ncbi:MAG: hypothetical protein MMC23_002509 [Stictis urceolatum]|nr:hypothetical protein [Stictis urceolata]